MIARLFLPLVLLIVLPDVYFELRSMRRRGRRAWLRRLVRLVPSLAMLVYTVVLAVEQNFVPDDIGLVNTYLFLLGAIFVPKALFALCAAVGQWHRQRCHGRRNWGHPVALVLVVGCWYVLAYGATAGLRRLEVRHVDVYFDSLPAAFDGYRILHFSDAHVGSYTGWRAPILLRTLDSIRAQHPDLIAFTGDLQNIQPGELHAFRHALGALRAPDGVVSVLGNHDYAEYIDRDSTTEAANCRETIALQRQWGWRLLLNEHLSLHRGADSIVVAGEENLEKPDRADFAKTMQGIAPGAFTVLLQHNPKAWDRYIRPSHRVQLTLSGHVHGGQVALFGLRPSSLKYRQDHGLYRAEGAALHVSAGMGALIPFRFGVPPEISVITLHRNKQ